MNIDHEKYKIIEAALSRAKNRSKPHKIAVSAKYVYAIGERQKWLCAYTKRLISTVRGGNGINRNNDLLTIDRIDSKLGYERGNIQIVTWAANYAKGIMSHNEFGQFIKTIHDNWES